MKTPVLLITFNRPTYTQKVLDALKDAKVSHLLIFKDGPRPNNQSDYKASKAIENMIDLIDWPCEIKTNFMNNNLGCGFGPYSAISWAFQYTDRLIILEDDCVPSTSFFAYCDYLLEKYKDDKRIRHISGFSPISNVKIFDKYDYIFTQYAHTWGWATWKRVWDNIDIQQRPVKSFFKNGGFNGQFLSKAEDKFFNKVYWSRESSIKESMHSWDYQYAVQSKMNGALSIVPAKNLISNIGVIGTHATGHVPYYESYDDYKITKEPKEIAMDSEYENINFKKESNLGFKRYLKMFILLMRNKLFHNNEL